MEIHQNSSRMIADWRSFDIGATESVTFQQPSNDSIALNRVTGNDPSQIFGKLSANGNLFLINPNGILFGSSAQIDVNGLVATTADIDNQDFMAGRYDFKFPSSSSSSIINQGQITVKEGGLLAFVAPGVENSGFISAQLGQVNLSSGTYFTLDFYGDKLVTLGVDAKVLEQVVDPDGNPLTSLVNNSGTISANGGRILMQVSAVKDIVDNVINMTGLAEAKTVREANGEIILEGGDAGIVNVAGILDASGLESGQIGGTVHVLGEKVGLFENAIIDVSGDAGGGIALIGGDYKGNGSVPNAFRTYFGVDATVKADALGSGDGGKVVVWSDDTTRFFGDISAKGGSISGNGGFVETSGKQKLVFEGSVDLSGENGTAGTLLLDPQDIEIGTEDDKTTGFTAGVDNTEAFGDDSGDTTKFDVTGGGSFNGIADGATIILQATNNIAQTANFNLSTATGSNNVNLVLQAGNNVDIEDDKSLTLDGTGTLHMEADSSHNGGANGSGRIEIDGDVVTGGGSVTLIGATFDLLNSHTVNSGAGDIIIAQSQSNQAFDLGTAGGGDLTDSQLDSLITTGTLTLGQATTKGTDGAGTGAVTLTAGVITLDELTQGAKDITLVSNSTINDDDDTGPAIATTGTLTLTSGSQIGNLGGAQGLDTDVGTLVITSTNGNNVAIDNGTTDLILGGINTGAGDFTLNTGGNITDTGVTTVGGTANITTDVANKSITLNTTTNALSGQINFTTTGTGDVTLDNGTTATNLGTVSVGQNLAVTSGEAITDSGVLTVGGTANFTTDVASKSITLDTTTNSITGAVSFSTTGLGDVTLDNGTTSTNLGTVNVGQNLAVTAGNTITDSGVLTVGGTSSFITNLANQSITLDTATNALTGAVSFSTTGTGDVTLDNGTTSTNLGTVNVGQNLAVTAGNTITDSGVLTVGGTSSFITDLTNQSITLDTATNALTGAVSFSTTGTGDASLTNNTSTILAASTVGDALTVNATGAGSSINVTGSLTSTSILLTAEDNIILDSGTLTASGSGNSLILASTNGGDFTNNVGAGVLVASSGRWLVYSTNPANDTLGGLVPDKKRYNTSYPTIPGSFGASDDGALYSIAPTLTITADDKNRIYGDSNPALTFGATGYIDGDNAGTALTGSITTAAVSTSDVGAYPITQGTLADLLGYTIVYNNGTLTINARPITLTANASQTKVYGASDPTLTQTITSGALQFSDTLTGASTRAAGEDVGNYAISQGALTVADGNSGNNYSITYVGDNFAITPFGITLTANASQTKVYGASDPTLTQTITSGALQFSDTLTGASTRAAGEDVGNYAISQGALTVADGNSGNNYSITYVGDNFAITPFGITLTADSGQGKVFGAIDPTLTSTITSGALQFTDTLTGALARAVGENVGSFTINQGTVTVADGNSGNNYTLTFVGDNFTITAAGVTQSPIDPPDIAKLIEGLESPNDQSAVNESDQENSPYVGEQRFEMEKLLNMDIDDLMQTIVAISKSNIKEFSIVESDYYLDFKVMNKMSPEDLMYVKVEPPENLSREANFVESQMFLEDELMFNMKPKDLMQVKAENREKIVSEFSVLEHEQGSEPYESCTINPLGNNFEIFCY